MRRDPCAAIGQATGTLSSETTPRVVREERRLTYFHFTGLPHDGRYLNLDGGTSESEGWIMCSEQQRSASEGLAQKVNDRFDRTSLEFEAMQAGYLVHWQPRWAPNVRLATDPAAPWFPTTFGWLGASTSTRVTRATSLLTADKVNSQKYLEASGVPTPLSRCFSPGGFDEARRFAAEIGWPLVVKPRSGAQGRGVSADIQSASHLELAFECLTNECSGTDDFLVQRHVTGRGYRILASRERVYGAYFKLSAHVVGDGHSTIEQLVEVKNRQRSKNPHVGARDRAIVFSAEAKRLLAQQGLVPTSIPNELQVVKLSVVEHTHRGADTVEITSELAPIVEAVAVRAIQAFPGLDYGGVDILLPGGHRDVASVDGCAVLEVNCGTGLGGHLYPMHGLPRNVCREIVGDTAAAAMITPRWSGDDAMFAIAVRLMHPRDSSVFAAPVPDFGPAETLVLFERETEVLAVLLGNRETIYAAINDHLARDFGTIIALRVTGDEIERDLVWLESKLPPSPFLPLRHAEAVASWSG